MEIGEATNRATADVEKIVGRPFKDFTGYDLHARLGHRRDEYTSGQRFVGWPYTSRNLTILGATIAVIGTVLTILLPAC